METVKPEVAEEVQTVTDEGKAVPRRILNATSAFETMRGMIKSDATRALERAKIKGMDDGQRPYPESELTAKGMGWRSNVNWGELRGTLDATSGSYTALVMELSELIDVDVLPEAGIVDPENEYAQIIAKEYSCTLTDWTSFIPNYAIMVGQFARYGRGLYFWSDPYSWKYQVVKTANHLVPENASVMADDHDLIMIRDTISPVRLYELIESGDAATTVGWRTAALKRLLVNMYKAPAVKQTDDVIASEYENLQFAIASRNLGLDDDAFKETPICYVLEKAMTGKTVHMTIIQASEQPTEYLYEKTDLYETMTQAVAQFMYNYGEGDLHSIKGLGHRAFAHVEVSNRLLNSTVDGQQMMNSLLVTGNSQSVSDTMRIARLGPITVIPDSLQVVQQNFQPRIDGAIALRNLLHASLNNNTGVNKSQVEMTGPVERTAAGVKHRQAKEASFSLNQTLLFYSQWDAYHAETFRRLVSRDYPTGWDGKEEADLFRSRCIAQGVPPQLLDSKAVRVKARRAIGSGSMLTKDEATNGMMQIAPSMPEDGAYNAMRDRASFYVGATNVERYFPKERAGSPTNQHSIATLENNDMFEGTPVLVGNDQRHTVHNDIHLQKAVEIAETYQQAPDQVDVVTLAQYFTVMVEHVIQHNRIMESNPVLADDAEVYAQTINALAKIRDELVRDAQKLIAEQQGAMEQAQSEAQGEDDPELRMKLERHAVDMKLKVESAKSTLMLKQQMQEHTIRMREIKEAHRLSQQRRKGQ